MSFIVSAGLELAQKIVFLAIFFYNSSLIINCFWSHFLYIAFINNLSLNECFPLRWYNLLISNKYILIPTFSVFYIPDVQWINVHSSQMQSL